jgi:hypothetical protein
MSTSDDASTKPSNNTSLSAESTRTLTDKPLEKPLDPETKRWIHRLVDGMRVLATSETERRKIAKKLF